MQTTYEKGAYSWQATTTVALEEVPGGRRILQVTTSKYGHKVRSRAYALIERGHCREYSTDDFIKELGVVVMTRLTEKGIRQAHEVALTRIAEAVAEAKAFYSVPQAA